MFRTRRLYGEHDSVGRHCGRRQLGSALGGREKGFLLQHLVRKRLIVVEAGGPCRVLGDRQAMTGGLHQFDAVTNHRLEVPVGQVTAHLVQHGLYEG